MSFLKKIGFIFVVLIGLGFTSCHKEVIGIAWRSDVDSEFLTNITNTLDDLEIPYQLMEQVKYYDLPYEGEVLSSVCSDENDFLIQKYADILKQKDYKKSNVSKAVKNYKAVIFTGGEDISATLYRIPENWHGIEEEKDYNTTRDVSDYILMSYCLDNNIPVLGFCRGSQMLGVVSGVTFIQDIPSYFEKAGIEYNYIHRNNKATPDSYRDYSPHNVTLNSYSKTYEVFKVDELENVPSWHHQAMDSLEGTNLILAGYTEVSGKKMVEIIERTDKTFAVGFQFHPEAAYVKHIKNTDNKSLFMDKSSAGLIFKKLNEL